MVSKKNRQIIDAIKSQPNIGEKELYDLFGMAMAVYKEDPSEIEYALAITDYVKQMIIYLPHTEELNELYWQVLLWEAPNLFESFLLYMERNRPIQEKFYQPRIKPLKRVVDAIQELADDKLDELFINLPSRTGKTTVVRFAYIWWGSRNTELSNLYCAYSDTITKAFYSGCQELITDPTYTYNEIFPENKIVQISGDYETVDLNRKKSYPTFTCRSIYGTLNGACDCNGLAIADDLLSGIEEALSVDRLNTVWGKFDNNFMQRLKQNAKLINMGTRWALLDPQGRRRSLLENNPAYSDRRFKVVSIPALDENEESNFDYPYNLGYNTRYYLQRRASFEDNDDMASWWAQFMQEPIERKGALFEIDAMRFYNGVLPEGKPDRVFMAVDEAYGGGDFVSAPVCYQYGDDYYIADVVFDNGDKFVTRPLIRDMIIKHDIDAVRFEESRSVTDYHEWIDDELKKKGIHTNIQWAPPSNQKKKEIRIFDKAPEIREMYFLENGRRSPMYDRFMQNIYSFKMEGHNKHDDAPDSMAQICEMKLTGTNQAAEIVESPF